MLESEKLLIFLCSGAAKAGNKKLSFRIASELVARGIGEIGTLEDLASQQIRPANKQQRMMFINDCRSSCVNILTVGIAQQNYVLFDVSPFLTATNFSIEDYLKGEMIPKLENKWIFQTATSHQPQ